MGWTRGPLIGHGSSAAVHLATTAAGEVFAVKSAGLSSYNLLETEHHLISQLSSPYIVKCLGSDITSESQKRVYNIFLEYISGGTLSDLIVKQGSSLDEGMIQFYAHKILLGLDYLHRNGIVHCDIKGQNLLIEKNGGLKIADFGCAKMVEFGKFSKTEFAGTPAYMSPEVARGEEQGFPADVWALGCTVIEMATGCNPWPEMKDPASALYRIGNSGDVPEFPGWFSNNGRDFLSKCLARKVGDRWTASELLRHEFLGGVGENIGVAGKSPTSVMDQGFWDLVEESDSLGNTAVMDFPAGSPSSRIRDLVTAGFSGDCAEGEDWVTVRDQGDRECLDFGNGDFDDNMIGVELEFGTFSGRFEAVIGIEDSLFDYFDDVISIVDGIISTDSATNSCIDVCVSNIINSKRISVEEVYIFHSY